MICLGWLDAFLVKLMLSCRKTKLYSYIWFFFLASSICYMHGKFSECWIHWSCWLSHSASCSHKPPCVHLITLFSSFCFKNNNCEGLVWLEGYMADFFTWSCLFILSFNSSLFCRKELFNLLNPKSDMHLISTCNITPESHTKVMRMKEMITNKITVNKFSSSAP